jgi:hypothetical protein
MRNREKFVASELHAHLPRAVPVRVMTATWHQTLRFAATRVFPLGFAIGAGMEAFMCATGFYKVATRKEAERRVERAEAAQEQAAARLAQQQQRRDVFLPPPQAPPAAAQRAPAP